MTELAEAHKRTEMRVEALTKAQEQTDKQVKELTQSVNELTRSHKNLEIRMEELAEAQKRTEIRMEELAEAQKRTEKAQERTEAVIQKLAEALHDTRVHLGGLSRSFAYPFENESYRNVPQLLQTRYGYEIQEKAIRSEIGGKEINFFCKALKDGKEVYIVGETKVRLDDGRWRQEVYDELDEKVNAVRQVYGDVLIQPILVTHFATEGFLDEAQ